MSGDGIKHFTVAVRYDTGSTGLYQVAHQGPHEEVQAFVRRELGPNVRTVLVSENQHVFVPSLQALA